MTELIIRDPATGDELERIPADTAASVEAKVRTARGAAADWARLDVAERVRILDGVNTRVDRDREQLARSLTQETGKTLTQARNELAGMQVRLGWIVSVAEQVLADEWVEPWQAPDEQQCVTWDPLGTIACISAWNYPWLVGINVLAPALAAGNAVLYKPSEYAARTGQSIADVFHQAGVPREVLHVCTGGPETGRALIDSPDIDGYFFTGSHATGTRIHRALAGRLIPLQLELGGKDPLYATDDLRGVKAAAAAAVEGAFYHNGQSCCAVERVYVHEAIWDEFVKAFVDGVEALVVGDPLDPSTDQGPLTRAEQVDVLESQVADAVAKGARLLTGGRRIDRPGNWFEPTVLVDVNHEMAVMQDESFGPIVGLMKVAHDDEAIQLMNDTRFGLTAAVYSDSFDRAKRILAALDTGTAYWNCCDRLSPTMPWSGRRDSGIGTTLSPIGIRAFAQPRAWHVNG